MTKVEMPLPLCAVCNKPVDKLVSWVDSNRDTLVFIAFCHGEQERCELGAFDVVAAGRHFKLQRGVAFGTKRLAPVEPPLPPDRPVPGTAGPRET